MESGVRRTVNQTSCVRLEIKKSVFIALVSPISGPEEAEAFIGEAKRRYPDASHHVYAWKISYPSVMQKHSDDNEPSGTAGLPIMDLISRQELEDIVVVVARYFGGIKLGTGGLLRAYVQSAEQAVNLAQPTEWVKACSYQVRVSYSYSDILKHKLQNEEVEIASVTYENEVTLEIRCPLSKTDSFKKLILDLTSGQAGIEYMYETEMRKHNRKQNAHV